MSADVDKLERARELVARPNGWGQGFFHHRFGTCCAYEALFIAHAQSADVNYVCIAANVSPHSAGQLTVWNDMPGRTQAEVVAVFDRAIELARQETA